MHNLSKLSLVGMTAIALTLFSPVTLDWQTGLSKQAWVQGDRAEAKSSGGGRSRGGSFSGGSSGSRSSGGSSSGARSSGSSSSDRSRSSDPGYSYSRPVYGYSTGGYSTGYSSSYSSGSTSSGDGIWFALIVVGGIIAAIAYLIWKAKSGGTDEKSNDIVTVTQLQVALLAQERDIQNRLSELTLHADMETSEGRCEMLKESVLALLRSPENWSHVYSRSQVVKDRASAGQVFEQISMAERSKVEAENLVNVGGKVRHQALKISEDADPGSYIIVTLLVGTEHDKPLFENVQTSEGLKTALQNLGAVSTTDLLILELLWNPQDSKESLTYDEMLEAYPEMGAIA